MKKASIVILAGKDESSTIMYHALKDDVNVLKVLVEEPVSKKRLIKNRIRRLGVITVFGQILFIVFNKIWVRLAKDRIAEIKMQYGLNNTPVETQKYHPVESVNSDEVISLLQELQPDAVVVNGTRIIAERVLESIDAPFINTHAGITPKYRGVHGGYWALAEDDAAHCGVTVHLVDTGVDTGGILYQSIIQPEKTDSFNTYPLLQLAEAIPLMRQALKDVLHGDLRPVAVDLPSKLWYHPTLWEYATNYLRRGVK